MLLALQRQAAESPALYLTHGVNVLLGCHTEEASKEQKTDKLYMLQYMYKLYMFQLYMKQHFSAS